MKTSLSTLSQEERHQIAATLFASLRGKWLLSEALTFSLIKLRKESNIANRRLSDIEDMELLHEYFAAPKNRRKKLCP